MKPEFYKKKLDNGLVVLYEKRDLPVVSTSASVKYGAAFETEKMKGISHFMEHLMFKGTKTKSQEEIAREIEKKGGDLNGYTSEEVTSYWNKLPSKHFVSGLNISSDLILNPKFDPLEFEKEKNVIIEEIKMYHDNPGFYVPEKIKELLYEKPFNMSIAGTENVVASLTRNQIVSLFGSVYTTDGMAVCVVGNAGIDFDEICRLAEQIYPAKKRDLIQLVPVKRSLELVEKRKGLKQAHFIMGFHSPNMQNDERYAYSIVNAYLFGGMSSKLFQEIREKRGLAYAVRGEVSAGSNFGYTTIYTGTTEDNIQKIKEIILHEIKKLKYIEQKDFDEAKEQLIGLRSIAREDSTAVMEALIAEEMAGSTEKYYQYEDKIMQVKLGDVRKIAGLKSFSSFALIPD